MVLESGINKEHKKYATMDADCIRGKPGICLPEGFFKGGKRIKERNILNFNIKKINLSPYRN
jgi:hypothetical protein